MLKRRSFFGLFGTLLLANPLKLFGKTKMKRPQQTSDSEFFKMEDLEKELKSGNNRYLPFLNVDKLRTGLYILPAGGQDGQQPHQHDEVYYVLSGKSRFLAGGETTNVQEGSVLYVKAKVEHRFFEIEEELKILVFFSNMA